MEGLEQQQLLYRRQYLIGPEAVDLPGWKHLRLRNGYIASVHPDLDAEQVEMDDVQVTLLGYLVDPYEPEQANKDVFMQVTRHIQKFEDLFLSTEHCGGRWLLLGADDKSLKLFTDPCGLRQVYYTQQQDGWWCAAQASTLSTLFDIPLDERPEVVRFRESLEFQVEERAWLGPESVYAGILHLLPNHYLNVTEGSVERFWPWKPITKLELHEAVPHAAHLLKGSIEAISERYPIMVPVTAGWESRTLLAASRDVRYKAFYYLGKHSKLCEESTDVQVPKKLLSRLGLQFNLLDCTTPMDEEFKSIYDRNTTMPRHLPKSLIIYHHHQHSAGKMNLCGITSEIAKKCVYTDYIEHDVTGRMLAKISNYPKYEYATRLCDEWLTEGAGAAKRAGMDIFDLFYWEMRMGNWGAMYEAEQDIAVDEFCPYNNRKLLTVLLSVNLKYRRPPSFVLYREIVKHLWPETLSEPVNPKTVKWFTKFAIKTMLRSTRKLSAMMSKKQALDI